VQLRLPRSLAKVVQINLVGTFTLLALAAEAIAATDPLEHGQRGVIVNTASIAAFEGSWPDRLCIVKGRRGWDDTARRPRPRSIWDSRQHDRTRDCRDTDARHCRGRLPSQLGRWSPFPFPSGSPDEFAQLVGAIVAHDYLNGETIRMDGALRMAPR
jgi:hypothetical protein